LLCWREKPEEKPHDRLLSILEKSEEKSKFLDYRKVSRKSLGKILGKIPKPQNLKPF
jgi:hypothetical protein